MAGDEKYYRNTGYTLFTPNWNNSSYGELMKLEGFDLRKAKGLRYIAQ